MEPLITNGVDPALLRVLEKRGQERDPAMRRRRSPDAHSKEEEAPEDAGPPTEETSEHSLDDLA